ncbi:MAG: glycosyltransferase family 39 protein [Elainellaceae cyanobacterium]
MLPKSQSAHPMWLRNFVLILIVLGIFFRFYNIDRKVYWYDETMTSLRVSGHVQDELVTDIFDGRVMSVEALLSTYQAPTQETLNDTMRALAEHPEHSPLYYLLARFWMQLFGSSATSIRLLSVLVSLLAIPLAYWLCVELFASPSVGWMTAALVAISPFHVLYAQEAREYALWTVTILLSSATLLWAMRREKPLHWITYGVTAALGLYVHPFSGFVSISHGIYVLVLEKFRLSKRLVGYGLASALSVVLFAPWLVVVVLRFDQFVGNTASVNADRSGSMPLFWLLNLSRVFFDLNQGPSAINPIHYFLAGLAIASLIYLCRKAPIRAWVFVITLIGVTGLALLGPDVILGGRRSSITRYAIPCYLGIEIAIAYLLTAKVTAKPYNIRAKFRARKRWRSVAIALAVFGIVSCAVSSQIPVWWHKSHSKSRRNPDVAEVVNQANQPLLVSDILPPGRILSLSHSLKPSVALQLGERPGMITVPDEFETVYLYLPSDRLKRRLERRQDFNIEPIEHEGEVWLWEAVRQSGSG